MSENMQPDTGSPARGPGAWIGAAILIAIGVVFLLQNMGYSLPGNWWALFLLIPAIGALASAVRLWQQAGGRYVSAMNGSLIAAAVLIALTVIFLFDLDVPWGLVWPIALILLGVAALARAYSGR